jgi:hypothetical protein
MTRRIVLALTAVAVLGVGAGAASATTHSSSPTIGNVTPDHQLCLLLYREDPKPQHICLNW